MNKNIILYISLLFTSFLSFSQDKNVPFSKSLFAENKEGFSNAVKEIKMGDMYYYRGADSDLIFALPHYIIADSFNHYSSDLNYKMGICFLHSAQKFKALEYLEFADKTKQEGEFKDINFYLGQAYQLDANWDEAISKYQSYKSTLDDKYKAQRYFINKKVSECKAGKSLCENKKRVWIDNLGPEINSEYPDFGPVISADNRMLYFTSRRPDSFGSEMDEAGFKNEDVYHSKREYEGDWRVARNIGEPVNSNTHDATVGLSPDGKSLLIYRAKSGKEGNILITTKNESGNWVELENIGTNVNTKYHESSATLSFDEKTLFFVSDKPGGYGSHDIYVSYWDEESKIWGKATNLGPTLNTEFEEKGVFFHPDNRTLYFSSEGHKTMGGLDIFKSVYNAETNEWSEPENIGSPINTPDDDVYFVVSGNERFAYYSSFREGGFGEKDIYKITFLGPKKEPLIAAIKLSNNQMKAESQDGLIGIFGQKKLIIFKGIVVDEETGEPLNAQIVLIDNEENKVIAEFTSDPITGKYLVSLAGDKNYGIAVKKDEYLFHSENFEILNKAGIKEFEKNIVLKKVSVGKTIVLRNVFFDVNKFVLRPESINELERLVKLMNENPTMKIELSGHTDTRGSAEHNRVLSENRAKAVVDYLIKNGISKDRLKFEGYGETETIITDAVINAEISKEKKEELHQENRRTEFKIISL
jgi:outer membrane protein OmpA-like peptidoglycan-associated protein/Tol biopolymer transport system component